MRSAECESYFVQRTGQWSYALQETLTNSYIAVDFTCTTVELRFDLVALL